ncbi:protein pangolin, isoforms A/H/I/S-like [Uranotaenia lowii]|uniref:protein pangolin, isoforms A/H/I/S-like n=1 Tax=Uranotaenia lowii TaxID=190385 RepID=UPI002479AF83|nr:protein pangolin, isoforms A/H/I/S-like [Uranotaenia lowii]XP_055597622.1 protein pangolin, isoforms A/H/I/S-like [Uranotaenia lowii]XP_055609004.1 protein pangolin, isoforms A/H/I/S-like [Uranotaenia lowii]XP_055609005.1 protein pangolin, isoforms A/H/I/S-like [Uranotaenia lowii]
MPHNSSTGDELGSTDEVKVFKHEGEGEGEEKLTENLLEEKSSLIDLTESEEKTVKNGTTRHDQNNAYAKLPHGHPGFNMGYLVPPYAYPNGTAGGLPVSMANKMGLPPFFCHNGDHLSSPPPAHCGILPYQLDPKAMGLTRPPLYSFPSSQYPYPMLSPDMPLVAPSWHTPSMYSPAAGFRNPYPASLQIYTSLPSDFYRYSPSLLPSMHSHPMLNPHHAIITPGPKQDISSQDSARFSSGRSSNPPSIKQEGNEDSSRFSSSQHRSSNNSHHNSSHHDSNNHNNNNNNNHHHSGNHHSRQSLLEREMAAEKKKNHVKKPLNAFMLYMKEMRAKVVAECTLKESAAINQILGRKWHSLSREEQSVYYDKARQERQMHMELYPGWTARDNYGFGAKKKKRKKDRSPADPGGNSMKKCRARYGLDQQNQWCKPCRRKKKCIRYKEMADNDDGRDQGSDDAIGSCESMDDSKSPEDDRESINQSLSSPRSMSVLSSLQSPSTSIASPLNLLASPATPTSYYHHDHLGLASMIAAQQQHLQNSASDKLNNISSDSGLSSQLNNSYSNNFSPYSNHHAMRNNATQNVNNSNNNNHSSGMTSPSNHLNGSSSNKNHHSSSGSNSLPPHHQQPHPPATGPPPNGSSSAVSALLIPPHLQQLNLSGSSPPTSNPSSLSLPPNHIKEEPVSLRSSPPNFLALQHHHAQAVAAAAAAAAMASFHKNNGDLIPSSGDLSRSSSSNTTNDSGRSTSSSQANSTSDR